MYSHEIEEYLKVRNYLITVQEYFKILSTSPQINHVKYEDNEIKIWTEDRYKFTLRIRKDK